MLKRNLLIVILVCLSLCANLTAEDNNKASKNKETKDDLTLEKLFPEKSFFGPSARSMEFSFDGKYTAYIYRPYKERRHGSDLWIYDVAKGQARRVTSVSVMSRFQESTREVKKDRIEKAKEADEKDEPKKTDKKKARDKKVREKKKEKEQTDESSQEPAEKKRGRRRQRSDKQADEKKNREQEKEQAKLKRLGDWVSDKDADDEKAPRYSGIESFTWSPKANELLFVSRGDIYRCKVIRDKQDKLARLTRTREYEQQVAWLPDASGYTYMQGDDLMKVRFRSYLAEQLYVKLSDTVQDQPGRQAHDILEPEGRA